MADYPAPPTSPHADLYAAIAARLKEQVPELANSAFAREAPARVRFPYALAVPVSQVPIYSSKGRIAMDDLCQITIYARSAAQAQRLGTAIDEIISAHSPATNLAQAFPVNADGKESIILLRLERRDSVVSNLRSDEQTSVFMEVLTFRALRGRVRGANP